MMVSILIIMSREKRICMLCLKEHHCIHTVNFFLIFLLYFQCGWSIPVELVIGSDVGIAYTTDSAITVSYYKISLQSIDFNMAISM